MVVDLLPEQFHHVRLKMSLQAQLFVVLELHKIISLCNCSCVCLQIRV